MHATGRIHLGLVAARSVGKLRAREDVEVVVGRVSTSVALSSDRRAEDDEILGDACGSISL